MIVEVGLFRIDAQRVTDFEPVAQDIRSAFTRGIDGLHFFHLRPSIEDPGRWAVLVGWESVDDHQRFVSSPEGDRQRELLEQFMLATPEVFHLSVDQAGGLLS